MPKNTIDPDLQKCRVCGIVVDDDPPWGEDGKDPNYTICPCCGAEFGTHDQRLVGIRNYRADWLAGGAKWFHPEEKPDDWDPEEQLKGIPAQFR